MNVQEKEKIQKMIVQNLKGIEFVTAEAVKVKDAFRLKMLDLNMHGRETYSAEFLEKEMNKTKGDFAAKMTTANENIAGRLDELAVLIRDRDAVLDLSNPALSAALSLIQTIGSNLIYEQAVKINANFLHDQSALNLIRAAYKTRGVISDGNIDGLIYDADSVINGLKDLAYQGLVQDGSINTFANKLAKLAVVEGTTTEKLPDQIGANDAIRKAAGLSVQ